MGGATKRKDAQSYALLQVWGCWAENHRQRGTVTSGLWKPQAGKVGLSLGLTSVLLCPSPSILRRSGRELVVDSLESGACDRLVYPSSSKLYEIILSYIII